MDTEEQSLQSNLTHIHQPTPRRSNNGNFLLTPLSTTSSNDPSQNPSPNDALGSHSRNSSFLSHPSILSTADSTMSMLDSPSSSAPPHKSKSILNLTSSTLFGIYSPNGYDSSKEEVPTPWGPGAQTPIRNDSFDAASARLLAENVASRTRSKSKRNIEELQRAAHRESGNQQEKHLFATRYAVGVIWRAGVLFLMGMAYGEFVTQLHNTQGVAPVTVPGIDRRAWSYLVFWGLSAVVTGTILPWMDRRTARNCALDINKKDAAVDDDDEKTDGSRTPSYNGNFGSSLGADWNPIVRTIGAFVGIAFAIRRLPWQSTLQVSLTLALVNPFLWYLIDRSKTGFALSSIVGLSGAAALLSINPNIVPSPVAPKLTQTLFASGITSESIGVATWISSVLFCSCVCFGNLGRRLNRSNADSL